MLASTNHFKSSANMPEGRQSPPPEQQAPHQGSAPVANPNAQGAAPSDSHAKDASEQQKHETLSSNPSHVMDDKAKEKTAKTT